MKKLFLLILLSGIFIFGGDVSAVSRNYGAIALTGGGTGALDAIDGTGLNDLDAAFVNVFSTTYTYTLDDDSGAAESSPDVISPDANAGTKRWVLQSVVSSKVTVSDSATLPPINLTERSAEPSAPVTGDIYLDDGTNTGSSNPGLRRYTGAAWEDINSGVDAAANLGDNLLIRGDGAVKGIQNSGITVSDTDNVTGVNDVALASISSDAGTTIAINLGTDSGDDFSINGLVSSTLVVEGDHSEVGIRTASPAYPLDVIGYINTDTGSGYKMGGKTIIVADTTNSSTLVGEDAGTNLLSSSTSNTAIGKFALYTSNDVDADNNTAVGERALYFNTSGNSNTAIGVRSLYINDTGYANAALGRTANYSNTSGFWNASLGMSALFGNTSGDSNTAVGMSALYNITSTDDNVGVGFSAGRFISGGATPNTIGDSSVFIGRNAYPLADAETNEIVIGANTVGAGSNTVTLGNGSIVTTVLKGNVEVTSVNKVAITTPASSATLTIADSQTLTVNGSATITNGTHSGTNTGDEAAASVTVSGVSELATTAEINTGTDSTRVIPVDQFVASDRNIRFVAVRIIGAATDVAVDTTVGGDFVVPFTGTILQADTDTMWFSAATDTAGTTGTMVVDVHLNGTTICTTNKLDIETTEKGTTSAVTQPDLTTTAISQGDILTFDIDAVHTTAAKGLTIYMAIRQS